MTIPLIVLCCAGLMALVEKLRPGRQFPASKHWYPRAVLLNGAQAGIAYLGAVSWDQWFAGYTIFDFGDATTSAQVGLGYLLITFVYYWWHRARHHVPLLWKWLHQVHHSPVRLEIITSFYKHPLEILLNGILSAALLQLVLGLNEQAVAGTVLITGLAELFYHWNVRTPWLLGFVFQRPESHCLHHRRGHHHFNYSDLPLWDMLFGTFHNPKTQITRCGFADGAESNLLSLLLGKATVQGVKS